MSTKLPFLPLHVADFLADTETLTDAETGAYVRILFAMWLEGGSVSADMERLRRTARTHPRKWASVWGEIQDYFIVQENGRLTQKRLAAEYSKAVEIVEKRKASGKRGGEAKALRTASIGLAIASVLPAVSQNVARLSPKHNNIERKINITTSEQDSAPVEAKEEALPSPADERRKKLDEALRRMGRLKDGKDEEAA